MLHIFVVMAAIQFEPFSEEETARLKPVYNTVLEKGQSFVRTIPGHVTVPAAFQKFQHRFKNWKVREDDVYVLTFAKNGTTWTQELVWLLQNDCNFEQAKTITLNERFPFMDFPVLLDFDKELLPPFLQGDILKSVEDMPSPRFMKSHLRLCLLPDDLIEKSKVVICLRNPKDTVVSYYHHEKLLKSHGYTGEFPTYFDLFMDNLVIYSPYFEYVKEAWERRNHPNVCLLFFEDMKKDLATNVKKLAKFFGKEITDEKIEALVDHLSFKKMKNNPAVNKEDKVGKTLHTSDGNFMRKGEVGDWKNYFTDKMCKRMDEAIERHFRQIGLEFKYE